VALKAQQVKLKLSTCEMIEEFVKQFFELFDEADYLHTIRLEMDSIKRNAEKSQSPYSLMRKLGRGQQKNLFYRRCYEQVMQRKKELVAQKIKQS
jgi:hypothetical protein